MADWEPLYWGVRLDSVWHRRQRLGEYDVWAANVQPGHVFLVIINTDVWMADVATSGMMDRLD